VLFNLFAAAILAGMAAVELVYRPATDHVADYLPG
jgi:hypothetical protein